LWKECTPGMTSEEMSPVESDRLLSLFGNQYKHLHDIAQQTLSGLSRKQAGCFPDLGNDWIRVLGAIRDAYPDDELSNSLMYVYFSGLFKEVYWFQLLFLAGNYPLLHRSLRFVWEMMFRAYHVDTYADEFPDDPDPPGLTVDDKARWLGEHERKMYRWPTFMLPLLYRLLPQAKGTEMEECYERLWDDLNEYVHPSKALLDRMVVDVHGFLVTDRFDKEWALQTINAATTVFDLVWLAVISRFRGCAESLAQTGLHVDYPIVTTMLESFSVTGER